MKESKRTFGFSIPARPLAKLQYAAKYDCRSTGGLLRWLAAEYVERFEREHGEIAPEQEAK